MDIGTIIKEYRKKKNLSQAELGEKIGVNFPAISKYENNLAMPPADKFLMIIKRLKIPIKKFFL